MGGKKKRGWNQGFLTDRKNFTLDAMKKKRAYREKKGGSTDKGEATNSKGSLRGDGKKKGDRGGQEERGNINGEAGGRGGEKGKMLQHDLSGKKHKTEEKGGRKGNDQWDTANSLISMKRTMEKKKKKKKSGPGNELLLKSPL